MKSDYIICSCNTILYFLTTILGCTPLLITIILLSNNMTCWASSIYINLLLMHLFIALTSHMEWLPCTTCVSVNTLYDIHSMKKSPDIHFSEHIPLSSNTLCSLTISSADTFLFTYLFFYWTFPSQTCELLGVLDFFCLVYCHKANVQNSVLYTEVKQICVHWKNELHVSLERLIIPLIKYFIRRVKLFTIFK
jgi:hypothetical protein